MSGLSRRVVGAALAAAAAWVVLAGAAARPARSAVVGPRFGLIEPQDAAGQAAELGAGWGRVRFHWALVQPNGPGDWVEAELSSEELEHELRAGREVIGLLIGVPGWARGDDGLPRGLYLPYDDVRNLWAGYVREAVTRYAGRIDHWIVWNEPDIWDPTHPGYTWPGDEADYVQLLKVAYLTAKEANPDAVIHLAAVSHWWDTTYGRDLYFPRLLDTIRAEPEAAAHDYYYDVATLHLYFDPASVYEVLEQYRGFQAERGLDKPIWLVETNAAPSNDPAWLVSEPTFRVSLLEQAAYMPQALALALAAGAERTGIYKLVDTPGDAAANPEPFGLLRSDLSPRPAFTTTRVAFERLAGAERAWWADRGVVSQVIVEQPGQVTRVLWARGLQAQQVTVSALADEATVVDMWGNEGTATAEDGAYLLILFAGECQQTVGDYCMIGGPPLYLIERVATPFDESRLPTVLTAKPVTPLEASRSGGWTRWAALGVLAAALATFELVLRRRLLRTGRSRGQE